MSLRIDWATAGALLALAGCAGSGAGTTESKPVSLTAPSWLGGKPSVTMLAGLKPGPYEPSPLAIGEERDLARQRGEGMGFVRSAALEQYLNDVRARLIAVSGKTGVPGRVMILASPTFDAISTPDGNVYLTMGALEILESADEVAAILAHEESHVLLRHHNTDIVGDMHRKGQALYELSIGAKTALSGRSTVAKGDAKTLQQVQLATETTDKVVFPAWNRGQEREADQLGTDLLVEASRSGPAMLGMLEKLQAWEKANAQTEQAFWDQLAQTAQRNVNDAANAAYQKLITSVSAAHPKTEERIADTAQYFERYYGSRPLVEPNIEPWKAVKSRPEVAIVMRVYRQAFAAKKLLDAGKAQEANAMARAAVAGRVAPDAYPNWVLAHTAFALGRQREGLEVLRRAVSASDPVPAVYEDLIVFNEAGGGLPAALDWTDRASKTFGGAPRWTPHKIRLLRKTGRVAEANALAIDCSLNAPDFKRACQEANQTPPGRAPAR